MSDFLKVFQIYFKEEQLSSMDYIPFLNDNCTPFFESEVIRTLIEKGEHKNTDYFGVVSYQLRNKLGYTKTKWKSLPNIANHSTNEFTPEEFEAELRKHQPDVMSFQRHQPHDPISYADNFHPKFSVFFKNIMSEIGYEWKPTKFNNVFYCNYFVAKSDIYEDFVNNMLIPAMEVMKMMPELFGNSGYNKQLPEKLKHDFGVNHYPFHSFLCERMFSFYVHLKNLNCLHF